MGISLRPEHLKRYRDLAILIAKYGRPGLVKQVGLDEAIEEREVGESQGDAEELGKLLSTRYDMLPEAYCDALARLQDDVEPFPFAEVEQIVTAEVGLRMSK